MADVMSFGYQDAGSEAKPPRQSADWAGLAGGGLVGVGVALVLVDALLTYRLSPDGAGQLGVLLQWALFAGALAAGAGLVMAGSWPAGAAAGPDSRSRRKAYGALLGAGLCSLPFVGSLAVLGDVIAGIDLHTPYVLLSQTCWLPAAAGSGLALVRNGGLASVGRPGRPRRADGLPLALLAISVAGALVTMVPDWVAYTLTGSMGPHTEECCNAFDAPGVVIAGTVAQMVVIAATAVAAALWRPARFGAVFLTGAVLFLANPAIEGIFTVIEAPPPAYFGVAAAARMTISVAGTPWLWGYCGFVAALIIVYEWLFNRSRPRPHQAATPVTSTESTAPGTADGSVLPLSLPLLQAVALGCQFRKQQTGHGRSPPDKP